MSILDAIGDTADLQRLDGDLLDRLAGEIRAFLVDVVCRHGGHLGPNLGAVELTIAVHRVFRSPRDPIVFDTGHQAYVHKVLTGRRHGFAHLRERGGLSGYPRRAESGHDVVENSHASTALAYADGLGRAFALDGSDRSVVVVVGDGALTGGLAWEALNNLAVSPARVVVVLNDNGRSYSPTVGGLAAHLQALRERGPDAGMSGDNLFRALGLSYLGPVDGHDIAAVERALRTARTLARPVLVHCVTGKGRGYLPAENDEADRLHTVGVVDPATGRPLQPPARTWTDAFGEELVALGAARPDLVAVSAAMLGPTGLVPFARRFPTRVVDVGIAEQHAVTSAAGLALAGRHPVVAIYATFLNRAFDQVLLDVALHRLPVTFVLDRAGITGPDGPSHHGMWDLALLGGVPGLRLAAPRDEATLREELREAVTIQDGPTVVRFPKATIGATFPALERCGGIDVLHADRQPRVLLVPVGAMAGPALAAAAQLAGAGIGCTVVDPRWPRPVSPVLAPLAADHELVVTVEDGVRDGGVGWAVARSLADRSVQTPVEVLGLPAAFIPHGPRAGLLTEYGLDTAGIARSVLNRINPPPARRVALVEARQ